MGLLGFHTMKIKEEELLAGDHIYTDRNQHTYYHHGIFIGDDRVIHFTKVSSDYPAVPEEKCDHHSNTTRDTESGVRMSCVLKCFLQPGHSLYRFVYDEGLLAIVRSTRSARHCTRVESVLRRANEELEEDTFGGSSLILKNCETFAYFCKTGVKFHLSKQVLRSLGFLVLAAAIMV
ncbi:hypothetical protein M758_6G041600 [Ceratodon purpureus]|uniref:LRAT domain-containing protein n=1 Tax=Ceratodon purpureus TaxID=3225 RepID=A0A8T0HEX9_CERPU|nr:hypothetical protein KC19_6G045200 [Ceratodon purpureus]KAG0612610.1 hypothetical protein M758_6G041600 [Ceratodon purpureus]